MLSLVELGRNWTFSRTRPKFGKIFVVMALFHFGGPGGHSSIAAGQAGTLPLFRQRTSVLCGSLL